MRDFVYEPLPSPRHIRLLHPLDSKDGEQLCFTLSPFPLKDLDNGNPSTLALSYTWGEPVFNHTIILNDCPFNITTNLHDALQSLGPYKTPIWVDAVCINQQDAVEKSSQILLMGEIYARSDKCIVWLGAASDDSALGWDLLCKLIFALEYHDGEAPTDFLVALGLQAPDKREGARKRLEKLVEEGRLVCGSPECLALAKIFSRPWFRRIWVMQEVFRSHNVLICCGNPKRSIRWHTFAQFCQQADAMKLHPYFEGFGLHFGSGLGNMRLLRSWKQEGLGRHIMVGGNGKHRQLAEMLRATYNLEATDPRDRIYALLGICWDEDDHDLEVQYGLSVGEVYTSYACAFLEKGEALWILYFSQGPDSDLDMPSWVPDWRFSKSSIFSRLRFNFQHPYRADDGLPPHFRLSPSKKALTAEGIEFDTIIVTTSAFDEIISQDAFASIDEYATYQQNTYDTWLKEAYHLTTRIRHAFPSNEQFWDEFWRTVCGNVTKDGDVAPAHWNFCAHIVLFLAQLALDPDKDREAIQEMLGHFAQELRKVLPPGRSVEEEVRAFTDQTRAAAWVNRLCITRMGRLGLASAKAKPGDRVCVLLGGHVPFVLRRCEGSEEDQHVLVGEAYVHGCMHGEVVRGAEGKVSEFLLV